MAQLVKAKLAQRYGANVPLDEQVMAADRPCMMNARKNHLRVAWYLFKRHWVAFLLAELTVVSSWVALEVLVIAVHWSGIPTVMGWVVWLCLHLAFLWIFCGLMAGIHSMALQSVDGGVPTFTTALSHLGRGRSYLMASLLYWAAVLVGLCLAVVPGIIVAVRWALFRFVLAGDSHRALSSLHEAALLSTSRRWHLFGVLALSSALNLAGAAFLGLGLLIAFPVTLMLRAGYFRALQQQAAAMRTADPLPATRGPDWSRVRPA